MIEFEGADQLARLAKALREAGNKDLQRELGKAINRAVKPLKADIKQSAKDTLPTRGGLAARVAKSKLTTRRRTSQKAAGVRVVNKGDLSLWHLDQGIIRHRVKGLAPHLWPIQETEKGFWTKPTESAGDTVRKELVKAMDDIAKKIGRAP